ncbi:MAG: hypothetical protein U5J83_03915 [Bryobacterales bacterium]|nr:hypothetical protein [Bryobacterales bacterium]
MEAVVAVGHLAGKPVRAIHPERIPNATYTEPGIGSVGLTEAEAKSKGYDVKVGKFPFLANSKAKILGQSEGLRESGNRLRSTAVDPGVSTSLGPLRLRVDRRSGNGHGSGSYRGDDDEYHSCSPNAL